MMKKALSKFDQINLREILSMQTVKASKTIMLILKMISKFKETLEDLKPFVQKERKSYATLKSTAMTARCQKSSFQFS